MIGKKIAQLRTQHKLSQKELARRTGVSVATVKNWEGDSSDPCLENIKSLSNIFNVTTDSLLGQNENLRLYHEELEEADIVLLNQISSNTWSTRSTATCARGPRRIRAAAVPLRCRRLPALFLLCLLPGGRNLGLVGALDARRARDRVLADDARDDFQHTVHLSHLLFTFAYSIQVFCMDFHSFPFRQIHRPIQRRLPQRAGKTLPYAGPIASPNSPVCKFCQKDGILVT